MTATRPGKIDLPATAACLGALACWAVNPIFIKYLASFLDCWTQNLLRYGVACVFWLPVLVVCLATGRLDRRICTRAIPPAAANVIMQTFWAAAFYYIDPALMDLVMKSSVLWIAGISLVLFPQERSLLRSVRFWLGMTLSILGVAGVTAFKQGFGERQTLIGILFAAAAAFFWAWYAVGVRVAFRNTDSRIGFSVISVYTVAGLLILNLIWGNPRQALALTPGQWACLAVSAILGIAVAHVLFYSAIRRIGATIPSLVILLTPFIVVALSHVFFGETLNPMQWASGLVLLVGAALAVWSQQHLHR